MFESHTCFLPHQIWVPHEHFTSFLSFIMFHRDGLSVLIHPLGKISYEDHTKNAMWLGDPFPLDTDILSRTEGDDCENAELGLGYNAKN